MRKGYNNSWLMDGENLMGINLGADFVAEHEWSISDLYNILGVDNEQKVLGIERYRVKNPQMDGIKLIEENKNNAALVVMCSYELKWFEERSGKLKDLSEYLSIGKDEELVTAWSGNDFGIRVHRPVNIKRLKRFYNAIANKEAAVWLAGGKVFNNAGLIIGLINEIPDSKKQEMYDTHLDQKNLAEASDNIGIKAKVDSVNKAFNDKLSVGYFTMDAPCAYLALKPAWSNLNRPSKYKVMYWLNPYDQEGNKWGWYTVEELLDWIDGKGPIKKAS